MKVLLIGCGRTGSSIAKTIIASKNVNKLILYDKDVKKSKALFSNLSSKKIKVTSNVVNLKKVEYVIVAFSALTNDKRKNSLKNSKTTYEARQSELNINLSELEEMTKELKKLSKTATIIVVTNPMDEITNYLRIKLGSNKVYGFGLDLDSARYSAFLERKVFCIGCHGKATPIMHSEYVEEYENILKKTDYKLLNTVRKEGIPAEIAGKFFGEFFNKLTGESKQIIHISSYLKKPVFGVKGVSISLPWVVRKGKLVSLAKMTPNQNEKKLFQISAKHLEENLKNIFNYYKNSI